MTPDSVTAAVLADLGRCTRGVVVDSPPGAGKSTLVVRAASELADSGEDLVVIAQTNEQVDDLVDRLATERPTLAVGRLSAQDYVPSPRILRHANVSVSSQAHDLGPVVLTTAAKLAMTGSDRVWPWAILDEAYQMRSDLLLQIAGCFSRALFVGDPGQLDPFTLVETERWHGLSWDPVQSAVAVLLRHNPDIPVHMLPVSWRLPFSAAPVVSEAFYPFTGFRSATGPSDRSLSFATLGLPNPYDAALSMAFSTGWAWYSLPARHTVRTDAEAVAACTGLAARLLERGAVCVSERSPSGAPVTASRIAIGAAHRDQVDALRRSLAARGLSSVVADTANRLQGREFDVTIVLHPLSGRRDATAFHLESGRLCVLTSRHRHACIVVARAGIPSLLDAHPSSEPVHLNEPVKFPDGWEANQALMSHLSAFEVPAI